MRRIALITDGIWPYVLGGMQKHSYYLCKYFAKNKIHVDLYHFNQSELNINELNVFTPEEKQYITSIVLKFPDRSKGFGHYIKNSYRYSELVYEAIKTKLTEYDFIYTKGFTGWKLLEEKNKGFIRCCKIGVKFHGYEMFQRAPEFKIKLQQLFLLRKPVKKISLMADVVFSYGGKITDIIKRIGVADNKIIEIPSGVELESIVQTIKSTTAPVKFVYLGRYERRKGIEELNQALFKLNFDLNFEFHFIGPIPELKKIKHPKAVYHGEIRDKKNLNYLLQTCDVLVCPSWSEGMPNVILEAMSNGLTVLASDVGATCVLVNEKNGWLLKEINSAEISEHLKKIIKTPLKEIDNKKENALKLIRENYTWETLIIHLIKRLSA